MSKKTKVAKVEEKVAPVAKAPEVKKARKPRATAQEMARRELAKIEGRAKQLAEFLSLSEQLFGVKSKAKTSKPAKAKKSVKREGTLEVAFRKVLAKKGKATLEEACEAILKGGYETSSENFLACLQQTAHKMRQSGELVSVGQDGRKYQYALKAA